MFMAKMAGRGVDKSDDNPFSFKSFVNDKDKKATFENDIFSDDEDDIFEVKETKAPTKQPPADNFGLDSSTQKDKKKENPFSFKKFLSGSASSNSLNKQKSSNPNSFAPPDIASDLPSFTNNHFDGASDLPSFTNNHFDVAEVSVSAVPKKSSEVVTDAKSKDSKKKRDNSLLFGSQSSNSGKHAPDNVLVASNPPLQLPLFDNDDLESGDIHSKEPSGKTSPGILQLPDFLSDGPLLSGKHAVPDDRGKTDEDLLSQIHILQEENSRLHKDLARMKQKCDDKNQRITQLTNDMERQKKKEAEETAVMEKAVLQVEENLVTTTQRAVQAESIVTKLNQEVKQLQNQVRSLSTENEAYSSGDGGLSDIRERTKYTSEQLKTAADVAENNLKDLLLGVDKMKLLSQVLASWEKVTEVNESGNDEKKSTS